MSLTTARLAGGRGKRLPRGDHPAVRGRGGGHHRHGRPRLSLHGVDRQPRGERHFRLRRQEVTRNHGDALGRRHPHRHVLHDPARNGDGRLSRCSQVREGLTDPGEQTTVNVGAGLAIDGPAHLRLHASSTGRPTPRQNAEFASAGSMSTIARIKGDVKHYRPLQGTGRQPDAGIRRPGPRQGPRDSRPSRRRRRSPGRPPKNPTP